VGLVLSEEGEIRRGCLASYSMVFGVGVFAFLQLPEPWAVHVAPEPPECDLLGDWSPDGDFRWVLKGRLKAFLVNDETGHVYLLSVEARTVRRPSDIDRLVEKRLKKLLGRPGSQVVRDEQIVVGGHEARCMVLITHEKPLLRRERTKYMMVIPVFCDKTGRFLWVELVGGPWLLEDVEELMPIMASLSCHEVV